MVDHAYAEFADEDLTRPRLGCPTRGAAHPLQGLGAGRAARGLRRWARRTVIGWLRAAGHPYAVSRPFAGAGRAGSARAASAVAAYVDAGAARARPTLEAALAACGGRPMPSQGNFVFARVAGRRLAARRARRASASRVRAFPGDALLDDARAHHLPRRRLRSAGALCDALETVLAPEALLFDMDGVLADVSRILPRGHPDSPRADFGVEVTAEDDRRGQGARATPTTTGS